MDEKKTKKGANGPEEEEKTRRRTHDFMIIVRIFLLQIKNNIEALFRVILFIKRFDPLMTLAVLVIAELLCRGYNNNDNNK